MLHLATLGALRLRDGDTELLAGRRKVLALLAFVARHGGTGISRASLAAMFWPDGDTARAKQSLRTALTELRAAVGRALEAGTEYIVTVPSAIELDADVFESDVAAGRLTEAADRWHGEFLAGLEDIGDDEWRSWLEAERASLRKQWAWALEQLVDSAERAAHWSDAVRFAERWVTEFPADERAATRLVVALRSAGRVTEASARHAELAHVLEDHNAAKPSAAFTHLGQAAVAPHLTRPGIRGLLTPDLIGREAAMAQLTEAWNDARREVGRVVLVTGDEGLGKTRLIEEFGRYLRGQGSGVVLQGRTFQSELNQPFSAWRPLLDQLASAPGLSAVPPEGLRVLGGLSSSIRDQFPVVETSLSSAGGVEQAIVRGITEVAYETPLALLLDDAPHADRESLGALEMLLRRPPAGALLVLTGAPAGWAQWKGIDEVHRLAHVTGATLAPLSREETRRFVATVAPMDTKLSVALADRLHRETDGRPGALQLVVAKLAEQGILATDANGRWTLDGAPDELRVPVPEAMQERMRARLLALPPGSRRVLESAAVIGPRVAPSLLETVAAVSEDEFRAAMADLLARRLLRNSLDSSGGLEFTGEAERRAVYEQIVPSLRRTMHRAAAHALRTGADDDRVRLAASEHRRLAGPDSRRRWLVVGGAILVAVIGAVALGRDIAAGRQVRPGAQVLLANVQNLTRDSTLGGALDLAARIGLQQSQRIILVPPRQVTDAVERMRRTMPTTGVDATLAREIALRENLPAFILLAVASVDSSYLITARVIEPEQERDLFATSVTATGRSAILAGLDEVLKRIRTALGESRVTVRRSEQFLPRVTTSSLEALRLFTNGRVQWTRGQFRAAGRFFSQAVQLDTSFALALISLGNYYYIEGDSGIDRAAGDRYLDRAVAHSDRLTERERYALLAAVARLRGRPDEAIEKTRVLAERFPDRDTWFDLGTTYMRLGRWKEATPTLWRALTFDSLFANAWINLASAYSGENRVDSALYAYARGAKADSARMHIGGNVNQEWGMAMLKAGKESSAESLFTMAAEIDTPLNRAYGMRSLAWLEMYRGRYRASETWLEQAATISEGERSLLTAARNRWLLASAYLDLGDISRARQQLDRADAILGDLTVDPMFLFYLASLRLLVGDASPARRLQQRQAASAHAEIANDRSALALLRAMFALRDGRPDSAIAQARRCENYLCFAFRDDILSDAYQRLGRTDSALVAAERLDSAWAFGYEAQRLWRHASLRVAELALHAGDTARARVAITRQLQRWERADADLPDRRRAQSLQARIGMLPSR